MNALRLEKLMSRTIEVALKHKGGVSPNPYVGCLIIIDNKIICEGSHRGPGYPHAEVVALSLLPKCYDREKVTLMVNLEPCCHFNKRTPPCAPNIFVPIVCAEEGRTATQEAKVSRILI